MTMKTILATTNAPGRHWVGDGFPVHGMFGYSGADVARRHGIRLEDREGPFAGHGYTSRTGASPGSAVLGIRTPGR